MKKFSLVLLIILSISIDAFSSTVTIQYIKSLNGTTKKLKVGGVNRHWYTGLYVFKANGVSWNSYCIDPFTQISNKTWQAHAYNSNDVANHFGNLFTYPGGVTAGITLEKYRMMNYLYQKYGQTTDAAHAGLRSNLSLTFWEIAYDYNGDISSLDLTQGGLYVTSGGFGNAHDMMAEAWLVRDTASLPYLFTPNPLNAGQEIFAPVPEPGTLLLLGSGLSALAALARYRRRKKIK